MVIDMNYILFINFDVVCGLILLFSLVRSFKLNQLLSLRNFIVLILSVVVVGLPLFLNVGGLGTLGVNFLKPYLTVGAQFLAGFSTNFGIELKVEALVSLFFVIVIILAILLVYGLFTLICVIFGGDERVKYRKSSTYVTKHSPVLAFFFELLGTAVKLYLLFVVVTFLGEACGYDLLGGSFLGNLLKTFDPIVPLVRNFLAL